MKQRKRSKKVQYKDESTYNPSIHTKTKGGYGFGMKKGARAEQFANSGVHLARVFGWEVPKELQHIKEAIDKQNGR